MPPKYSTGDLESAPKTMSDEQIPPRKRKGKDRTLLKENEDDKKSSSIRNGEDPTTPNLEIVVNR